MNKTQLVESVAKKAELTQKDAAAAVNAVIESVKEALVAGDSINIIGFGSFVVRERAARKGLNPQTKEPIDIPASKVPAFKPGKTFKDALNK